MSAAPARSRNKGLRYRVSILVTAGMLAATALVGFVAWTMIRRMDAEIRAAQEGGASAAATQVGDGITLALARLQDLETQIRPALVDGDRAELQDLVGSAVVSRGDTVDAVLLVTARGELVATDDHYDGALDAECLTEVRSEVVRTGRPVVSCLVEGRATGRGGRRRHWVFLAVPVPDWQARPIGVVIGALDVTGRRFHALARPAFQPWFKPIELLDRDGRVLASDDPARQLTSVGTARDADAIAQPVPLTRWVVVTHRRGAHVLPQRELLRMLAWAVPLLFVVAYFYANGAAHHVVNQLRVLTAGARRITDGDLSVPVVVPGDDEVGQLGRAFDHMRVALKQSLEDLAAANAELEQRVADRTRELAAANQALQDREQVRQQLLRKVITAQEDERKRLARELHDETLQTITALSVRLDTALAAAPDGEGRAQLEQARALTALSLDELRRLMHDLRPSALDDLGLVAALRWYADRQLAARGLVVRFEVEADDLRLPYELETALFRAAQEAMNNVARHAGAEMVLIQVVAEGGRVRIDIEDDGRGFDRQSVVPRPDNLRGLGLLGMRERVELFDGRIEIDSAPGQGTHVFIDVPVPETTAHGQDQGAHRG